MKKKSRHKRKIELLNKLVKFTDFYVAHVWNEQGKSMHGFVDSLGRQKFKSPIDLCKVCKEWFTPWFGFCPDGKIYFAIMPRTKPSFGTVLQGWKELKFYLQENWKAMVVSEKHKR